MKILYKVMVKLMSHATATAKHPTTWITLSNQLMSVLFPNDTWADDKKERNAYLNVLDGSWVPNWAIAMKNPVSGKVKLHHPIDHST